MIVAITGLAFKHPPWLLAGLVVLAGLGCTAERRPRDLASATSTSNSATVTITDAGFVPESLTVERGTAVTWTNQGSAQHTVTRPREGGIQVAGPDSPTLRTGDSYRYTYNAVGIFDYHCSIHPTLTGSVTVTAP